MPLTYFELHLRPFIHFNQVKQPKAEATQPTQMEQYKYLLTEMW